MSSIPPKIRLNAVDWVVWFGKYGLKMCGVSRGSVVIFGNRLGKVSGRVFAAGYTSAPPHEEATVRLRHRVETNLVSIWVEKHRVSGPPVKFRGVEGG